MVTMKFPTTIYISIFLIYNVESFIPVLQHTHHTTIATTAVRTPSCSELYSTKQSRRQAKKRQGFHPTNTSRRPKIKQKHLNEYDALDHTPLPPRNGIKIHHHEGPLSSPQTHRIHLPSRHINGAPLTYHDEDGDHTKPLTNHNNNNRNPVKAFLNHILPNDPRSKLVSNTAEWKNLQKEAENIETTHLRDLLKNKERCDVMYAEHDGVYLDYSRQRATLDTIDQLLDLAEKQDLKGRMNAMRSGEKINFTEDRAVLHTALRANKSEIGTIFVDDVDVVQEVHEVLDSIKTFTNAIRSGKIKGYTGKRIRNIVSVGIGGSYLGPEFLHEVLKTEPEGINSALGYSLQFLANVDPIDVERTCTDLDPEETLIVIVSKTFTTAETMLNARTMRQWLWDFMGNDKEVVKKHVVACASISAIDKVAEFGINTDEYFFRFWDWVGGRYSVCSAAGAVPISLLYGYDLFEKFLLVSFFCNHWILLVDYLI